MAFSTPSTRFLVIAFAIIIFISPPADAITCGDVFSFLSPCVSYLRTGGGSPPKSCCTGASRLVSAAKSRADRQAACSCIKNAASSFKPKPEIAMSLPMKCGISLPFEVSPSVNCSKIN